jgi:toxin HigB-1
VAVIQGFRDSATRDIHNGLSSKAAGSRLPKELWRIATRKLDQLHRVVQLAELQVPPGNKLEALKKDRSGQDSVRINDQYRICFTWTPDGPTNVEITDYH